ncbi:MAG: sialidase family protein, partial [Candidatus Dormibacteria bacterium]
VYPHAVYYCNQSSGVVVAGGGEAAYCGLSLDGGLTYDPAVPIYSFAQCGGLHGHVRVAPDGTAIVPNQNCGPAPDTGFPAHFPNQAAVLSRDNGLTWAVHVIPDSVSTFRSDPSVAADSAGKLYFAYESGVYAQGDYNAEQIGGRAMLASSSDDGTTWTRSVDVGAGLGIQNLTFPEVIAGSAGRAAYAFLGSTTAGNPEDTSFQGLWDLYISFTYDGGNTWTTSDLTPNDPVERNCIYLAGNGTCPSTKRNLLDFMDITVDKQGRALVGYADGCTGTCVSDLSQPCSDTICSSGDTKSTDTLVSIARLSCGDGLFAQYDTSLACANAVVTPEVPWLPGLLVVGAGSAALVWRRQRRAVPE